MVKNSGPALLGIKIFAGRSVTIPKMLNLNSPNLSKVDNRSLKYSVKNCMASQVLAHKYITVPETLNLNPPNLSRNG